MFYGALSSELFSDIIMHDYGVECGCSLSATMAHALCLLLLNVFFLSILHVRYYDSKMVYLVTRSMALVHDQLDILDNDLAKLYVGH